MKHVFSAAIAGAAFVLSVAGFAQVSNDPAKVEAGSYKVDSHHSLVQFSISHLGFNDFYGTLPNATGTLILDPAKLSSAKLDVSVPVADLSTTNAVLDGELKGADWFDAAKHPTMRFVSTSVTSTGPRTAKVEGTLTMHGVSKPVTLDATLGGTGQNPMSKAVTVGFSATGKIKRSDFGVARLLPMIGDDVALRITAAFERQK